MCVSVCVCVNLYIALAPALTLALALAFAFALALALAIGRAGSLSSHPSNPSSFPLSLLLSLALLRSPTLPVFLPYSRPSLLESEPTHAASAC